MLYREWKVREANKECVRALAGGDETAELLYRVLAARGFDTAEAAAAMLHPPEALPDAMGMRDMDRAVARIHEALGREERIAVFGDYDVDGMTATALVYTYLESMGAQVFYKLPSRRDDDYGLSPALVDAMADRGITLIITVDNGTTAFEAIQRAKERGVSVVVTDHHLPYDTLPEACAVVNPCREDDESGLRCLCGAGVAFMLLAALEGCPAEELLPLFGDLVAIGTVADVMKLTGPNRVLVRAGLAALQETERPGLAALIEACGWRGKEVTAENISYGIAPRLNAAGRMDDATAALQLLLAADEEEAAGLVEMLQKQNAARQAAEQEILALIAGQMEADPDLAAARVLVIWGDGWHQGVIGIVASRLVDKYAKPAIVVSFDGREGRGSGRSFGGFSLHGAISSCEDILLRYGGHDLAAGFSLMREHVEQFRKRVNRWAAEHSPVPSLPVVWADAPLGLDGLRVEKVRALQALAPFGSGNQQPVFLLRGAVLEAVYSVGEGRHSRLRLKEGGGVLYAVLFGSAPACLAYRPGDAVDVMLSLSVYSGRAGQTVSARVADIRPAGLANEHARQSALFENVVSGAKPGEEEARLLFPAREDTAAVYRYLRGRAEVSCKDLRPLFAALGEEKTGKIQTSLATLQELELVGSDEARGWFCVAKNPGKKDLDSGALMQKLSRRA